MNFSQNQGSSGNLFGAKPAPASDGAGLFGKSNTMKTQA